MTKPLILILILMLVASACSTPGHISIKSNPEGADILVYQMNQQSGEKVGQTPLVLTSKEIAQYVGGSESFFLELQKEGHLPLKTFVTDLSGNQITLNLSLHKIDYLHESASIQKVVNQLFACQTHARNKDYAKALDLLKQLKIEFPNLSIIYEMEGGLHLIQKDYDKAIISFNNALKHAPKNAEAQRMKKVLLTELGIEDKN